MRPSRPLLAAALAGILLYSACSEKLAKQTRLSDADLLAGGLAKLERKKYGGAIEHFQTLLERFPNSPLAGRAQLGLAEARDGDGDDIEAETAYTDFVKMYPADNNVPYALFRKGELLFRGASSPLRDQSKTLEAVKAYGDLLGRDPAGPYASRAKERVVTLRGRLAAHEGAVAAHYLKRKNWESAEARSRWAAGEYKDTGEAPALLTLLAEALERQGRREEAAAVRKEIAGVYPGYGTGKK